MLHNEGDLDWPPVCCNSRLKLKSFAWTCNFMNVLFLPLFLDVCASANEGIRHAWNKPNVDNKTNGTEGRKQSFHVRKLRFIVFYFRTRWDEAFSADHSTLTTRYLIIQLVRYRSFGKHSFSAEKIVLIILLVAHPNHLFFSHLTIAIIIVLFEQL